jgi:hypothetical protein
VLELEPGLFGAAFYIPRDDCATASHHPRAYFPDPFENRKSVTGVMN